MKETNDSRIDPASLPLATRRDEVTAAIRRAVRAALERRQALVNAGILKDVTTNGAHPAAKA